MWNPATISALCGGIAGILVGVTALVKAIRGDARKLPPPR